MIKAEEVKAFLENSSRSRGTIIRGLSISEAKLDQYLTFGIQSLDEIRRFKWLRNGEEKSGSFSFDDILMLQQALGYKDIDMQLLLGIHSTTWTKWKKGSNLVPIPAQVRKLVIIGQWMVNEGYDVDRYLGLI